MAYAVPNTVNSRELPADYSQYIARTRQAVHARLSDAPAGDMLREYFGSGKMLRAFLVFAASASVGGDPDDVVAAAEAIELLHGASLIHDDIIDQAAERRGMAALHERLGIGRALVVGDDLLLRAFAALSDARPRHPAARLLEATELLNQFARECCKGQFEELCAERWISEEEYLSIISAKTAAPFVAAGVLGAVLGGGDEAQIAAIRLFARQLGIAFQIDDDLRDLVGERHLLGKPVGNSLAQGRPMLPLIYLWEQGSDATRKMLRGLDNSTWSRDQVVRLLDGNGILERVRDVQQRYVDAAMKALHGLRGAKGVDALRALAERATVSANR